MASIDFADFPSKVRDALRAAITDVIKANPDRSFYTFAIFTDDSLQFAFAAANTEEGLAATVKRYNVEVDPKHDTTSTLNRMRWAHGDWECFPIDGAHFSEINGVLEENFDAEESVFEAQIESLWQALLDGFRQLEDEGFFGVGEERSRITLLVVGDLKEEVINHWARTLNPPAVAQRFIEWDYGAPDL